SPAEQTRPDPERSGTGTGNACFTTSPSGRAPATSTRPVWAMRMQRGSCASCRTPRVCTIVKVLPWGLRRLELLVDGSSGPNARSGVHAERISASARGHGGSSPPTSDQARRVPYWTAGFSQEGKSEMRKAFEIGGLAAGLVLVGFGVVAIWMGVNGRPTVP